MNRLSVKLFQCHACCQFTENLNSPLGYSASDTRPALWRLWSGVLLLFGFSGLTLVGAILWPNKFCEDQLNVVAKCCYGSWGFRVTSLDPSKIPWLVPYQKSLNRIWSRSHWPFVNTGIANLPVHLKSKLLWTPTTSLVNISQSTNFFLLQKQ